MTVADGDSVPSPGGNGNPCGRKREKDDESVLPDIRKVTGWPVQVRHPVFQRKVNASEPSTRMRDTGDRSNGDGNNQGKQERAFHPASFTRCAG